MRPVPRTTRTSATAVGVDAALPRSPLRRILRWFRSDRDAASLRPICGDSTDLRSPGRSRHAPCRIGRVHRSTASSPQTGRRLIQLHHGVVRSRATRLVARLALLSLAAGTVLGVATPASASVTVSDPDTDTWYCTYLSSGHLCISYVSTSGDAYGDYRSVQVHYDKLSGQAITVWFSYTDLSTGATVYDPRSQSVAPVNTVSSAFPVPSALHSVIGHMWVSGQGTYDTPSLVIDTNVAYYSGSGNAGSDTAAKYEAASNRTAEGDKGYDGPWAQPGVLCSPSIYYADTWHFAGIPIDRLAGWSLGRLGPVYALRALKDTGNTAVAQQINFVILFDPGPQRDMDSTDQDANSPKNTHCDSHSKTVDPSGTLKWWLDVNPNAHLVILSGYETYQSGSPGCGGYNSYCDAGIKAYYLKNVAGQPERSRVLVCDYPQLPHTATYVTFADRMVRATLNTVPSTASCPYDTAPYAQPQYAYNP
jgi:hypothetical protein